MLTMDYTIDVAAVQAAFDRARRLCREGDTLRGRVSPALRAQLFQAFVGLDATAGGVRTKSTDTSAFAEKFEIFGFSMVVDFTLQGCCLVVERMRPVDAEEVRSSCVPAAYLAETSC